MLISLFKIYLIFNLALHIDEAFNYAFLASRGFWVSITYYPGPNNHIFYTAIVSFLNAFNLPVVLSIRLPNLLFSQLSFLFVFSFFYYENKKFWQAFFLASIFWNLAPITYHGFLGRGYMLSTFLSIILIWVSIKIAESKSSKLHILFILISVLGFYTIPTFLYVWLSVCFFLLLHTNFKKLFLLGFWTILWTFCIYVPVIFFNGINALVNNSWVKPLSFQEWFANFFNYFDSLGDFFFGFSFASIWLLFIYIILIFLAIKLKTGKEYLFSMSLLIFPFTLIFFQRLLPFERVWTYQVFPLVWGLFLIFRQIHKLIQYFLLFILLCFFLIQNNWNLYKTTVKTPNYHILTKKIIETQPKNIYVNEDLYFTFLNFYKVTFSSQTSIHTKYDLGVEYDYLILSHKNQVKFKKMLYKFVGKSKEVIIFRKKNKKNLTF